MEEQLNGKRGNTPGPRPGGKISITAANQKQVAPHLSVYRGLEPDEAYRQFAALDSRGRGRVVTEWFELRQVTPELVAACELALAELTRMGVNQKMPVMVALRRAIGRAGGEL